MAIKRAELNLSLPALPQPRILFATQQAFLRTIMADRQRSPRESIRARDSRSRSPRRHHESSHRKRSPHTRHHHRRKHPAAEDAPKILPFGSRQLTKRDYDTFRPMFALYLDIQKGKSLEEMDETEARGRWKSFFGKWYEEFGVEAFRVQES